MTVLSGQSQLLAPLFSSAAMRAVVDDRARLQRMLDFEAALARAEAAVGVIPTAAVEAIAAACDASRYDLAVLAEASVEAGNIAVPLVNSLTAEVRKRDETSATFVHWGATSQDVIDTALVLELRAAIDVLLEDLDRATRGFTALAGKHRRNMTIARTFLQDALPMPFGLKLAGYAAALARSRERLRRLRREALAVQFGGAAGTLAVLGDQGLEVSDRLAALLDLPAPDAPWHSHRDRLAEIASAFAILAGTCGKIARDVALLMQSEVAEAFESPSAGRGSSATLPNKRNPNRAAAALAAAMAAPQLAATLLSAQMQEHERAVGGWHAEWLTFPALCLVVSGALDAIAGMAEGLEIDVERMKANLERSGGTLMAEAVSYALAPQLGRAEAHGLAAELSEAAARDKRPFREVLQADARVTAHLGGDEIGRLLYPTSYQGSAQTFIDRLVASAQGRIVVRRPRSLEPIAPAHPAGIAPVDASPAQTRLPRVDAPPLPQPTATAAQQPAEVAAAEDGSALVEMFMRSAKVFARGGADDEPDARSTKSEHKPA